MGALPLPDVLDLDEEVRVLGGLRGDVEHHRRSDELARRDRGDVVLALPRDPVVGSVEVGAGVLAAAKVVPVPRRSAVVVPADLLELELRGLPELGRKLDHRRARGERRREVDDLDGAAGQARDKI
jgi:hypothetical protein